MVVTGRRQQVCECLISHGARPEEFSLLGLGHAIPSLYHTTRVRLGSNKVTNVASVIISFYFRSAHQICEQKGINFASPTADRRSLAPDFIQYSLFSHTTFHRSSCGKFGYRDCRRQGASGPRSTTLLPIPILICRDTYLSCILIVVVGT